MTSGLEHGVIMAIGEHVVDLNHTVLAYWPWILLILLSYYELMEFPCGMCLLLAIPSYLHESLSEALHFWRVG